MPFNTQTYPNTLPSSYLLAAKSINLTDRGQLAKGKLADIVLLSEDLHVEDVYKLGVKVF